jgi:hypothetical protein
MLLAMGNCFAGFSIGTSSTPIGWAICTWVHAQWQLIDGLDDFFHFRELLGAKANRLERNNKILHFEVQKHTMLTVQISSGVASCTSISTIIFP